MARIRNWSWSGWLALLLIVGAASARAAQREESFAFSRVAMPELLLGVGTRITAMGGAGAVLSNDLTSLYWNPAGLSQRNHMELEVDHNSWIQGVGHEFIGFGMPLLGATAAVGLNFLSLGEIERTAVAPDGTLERRGNTLALSMFGLNVGFGVANSWGLAYGVAGKFVSESLGDKSPLTLALDGGLQYAPAEGGLLLGLAVRNAGLPAGGYSVPTLVNLGAGYALTLFSAHELVAAAEAEMPMAMPDQLMWHGGLEYVYDQMFSLRGGFQVNDVTRQGTGGGPTAGLGFKFGGWRFGYTFAPQGDLGGSHRISLSLDFDELAKTGKASGKRARGRRIASGGAPKTGFTASKESGAEVAGGYALSPRVQTGLSAEEQAMRSLMSQSLSVTPEIRKNAVGAPGIQEIVFRVQRSSGPRIKNWSLSVRTATGKELALLQGPNLPESIRWNVRDANGKRVANLPGMKYRLVLNDINDGTEVSEGPVMIVASGNGEDEKIDKLFQVLFEPGHAEITPEASEAIAGIAEFLKRHPDTKVLIEGYCDPGEEAEDPLILSKSRAESVSRYLTAYHKIPLNRILIKARGTSRAKAAHEQNRRVDVTARN